MSSEDEFFDAPEAFGCGSLSRKWSDNDELFRSFDFERQNARRRSRVESLKRNLIERSFYHGHYSGANSLPLGDELRRETLSDDTLACILRMNSGGAVTDMETCIHNFNKKSVSTVKYIDHTNDQSLPLTISHRGVLGRPDFDFILDHPYRTDMDQAFTILGMTNHRQPHAPNIIRPMTIGVCNHPNELDSRISPVYSLRYPIMATNQSDQFGQREDTLKLEPVQISKPVVTRTEGISQHLRFHVVMQLI